MRGVELQVGVEDPAETLRAFAYYRMALGALVFYVFAG